LPLQVCGGPSLRVTRDDQVVIATKFGFDLSSGQSRGVDSRSETITSTVEDRLRRLRIRQDRPALQHRVHPNVPIEDVAGTAKSSFSRAR
jgi:aryl-alcohol dehydrogenase-like predicted oxidoreductase